MIVNGQPNTLLFSDVFPTNGPGNVCVVIRNVDFTVRPGDTFALDLQVTNLNDDTVGVVRVPINDIQGPEVNPNDSQAVAACSDPNTRPVANAGADQNIVDTNGQPGETVTLTGLGSTDADAGTVLSYVWRNQQGVQIATGPSPTVTLPDGPSTITLTVTDDSFDTATNTATDTVTVTIAAPIPNVAPTANAGTNQALADTDGLPGETATLNGTLSTDSDGQIVTYQWFLGQTTLGTGATLQARIPDGVNVVTLVVTDDDQATATSTVQITVAPPNALPIANAGPDQSVADTDREAGELVTLNGAQSSDPNGTITNYQWLLGQTSLGAGATLQTRLPDGVNVVTLVVTDNSQATASDTVQISVAAPPVPDKLSEIPNLSPKLVSFAQGLDGACGRLFALERVDANLSADQRDLLAKCDRLLIGNTQANQVEALEELTPEDFSLVRTQTLLFANTQFGSVLDRLMALRGGARGLSLAGLNIIVDGKLVSVAQLKEMAQQVFGGGASADEPGGLLSDKWGMWARGNYSFGDKDTTAASPSFDADQWSLIGGADYRLSDKAVIGGSLAYGDANIAFTGNEGVLDTTSWSVSAYGSFYAAKNFYFDAIVNAADASFEAERNITYVDGGGLVSADASGDTDGLTLSGGISGGYDFLIGGLTLSPNAGFFYIDSTIDGFTEKGAAGLNLVYDEQTFESLTANLGLRATYAWNLRWGVLLPHLRIDYVREFEDDADVFGVRFAADPNATSAPPILVQTENPDESYWRLAAGFSAQFKYGVSGYIEYQRLESFEFITFQDVSVGLRFQRSF